MKGYTMESGEPNSRILELVREIPKLNGIKFFITNALNYASKKKTGSIANPDDMWSWFTDSKKLSFSKSLYRTVTGIDHTMFVLDLDPYIEDKELIQLTSKWERRFYQLKATTVILEELHKKDDRWFSYFSGKGAYMIRRVEPAVSNTLFYAEILKLITLCKPKGKQKCPGTTCTLWHDGEPKRLYKYVPIYIDVINETYPIKVVIDLSMITKEGRHVFRFPYSLYTEFGTTVTICAPVVWNTGKTKVDFKATLDQTDLTKVTLRDFIIPVQYIHAEKNKPLLMSPVHQGVNTAAAIIPQRLKVKRLNVPPFTRGLNKMQTFLVNQMEQLLISDPKITPPCVKNAYIHKMPDPHWNRVIIGRYLLHKGYGADQIATFIRFKVNDAEDNDSRNAHRLDENMYKFIIPTSTNPRRPPSCDKIQDPKGQFFACRTEDAIVCGRGYILEESIQVKLPMVTNSTGALNQTIITPSKPWNATSEADSLDTFSPDDLSTDLTPEENIEHDQEVFGDVIDLAETLIMDNSPKVVTKTTRAGLTTSLVIASQRKKQRLLVLEPTNKIIRQTFPTAVKIAQEVYNVDVTASTFPSNPRGCLKLMMRIEKARLKILEQNKETEKRGVNYLEKLPFLLKPECVEIVKGEEKECVYYDDRFTLGNQIIMDSEIIQLPTTDAPTGMGRCARISVTQNLPHFNVVFATYAKITATTAIQSKNEEGIIIFSELTDYDVIMLDEVSTLMEGQPSIIPVANIKKIKGKLSVDLKTDNIRKSFARMVQVNTSSSVAFENLVETALAAIESEITDLSSNFIRHEKRAIMINNPLSDKQREQVLGYYAVIQKLVEDNNVNLIDLAVFLTFLMEEQWIMATTTEFRADTIHVNIITKPELTLVKMFISWCYRKGKTIIVTDATLPPMSIPGMLGGNTWDWKEVDLGDPRNTNSLLLIIPDSQHVSVTDMEKFPAKSDILLELVHEVLKKHTQEDTMIVFPNQILYRTLKTQIKTFYPNVYITYYRSDATVGVASARRTMIAVCNPLPPEDAYDWLAAQYIKNQTGVDAHVEAINGKSQEFQEFSAKQAFYQTIGRVKDPVTRTPSVVYCFGINHDQIKKLLRGLHQPRILENPGTIKHRIMTGSHWKRSAKIFAPKIFEIVEKIQGTKGGIKLTLLDNWFVFEPEHVKNFFLSHLDVFNLKLDEHTNKIKYVL
jgi:hypothetical protein